MLLCFIKCRIALSIQPVFFYKIDSISLDTSTNLSGDLFSARSLRGRSPRSENVSGCARLSVAMRSIVIPTRRVETLKRVQSGTFAVAEVLPRRLLAWTIHEMCDYRDGPFAHRLFCSLGNTVRIPLPREILCGQSVHRDNCTFHE